MSVEKATIRFATVQYYEVEVVLKEYAHIPSSLKSRIEALNELVNDPRELADSEFKKGQYEIDYIGYDIAE